MKKRLPLIIALVAAVSLFSITAVAFTSNNTGYEVLKDALQSAKHFDNGTFDVQVEVTDNDQVILGANIIGKADHANKNASGQFVLQANGLAKTADFYQQDDTTFFVDQDNDLYYQINNTQEKERAHMKGYQHNEKFEMTASQEAFIDYLAGDLKNQIGLVENANGTKTVSLNLDKKDIPLALNLMVSAAASSNERNNRDFQDQHEQMIQDLPFFEGLENLEKELPELKEDVKVTGIVVTLTLDAENQMVAYDLSITVEGKEVNGTAHTMTVKSTGNISEVGQTVVDQIDVTGKDVKIIDSKKMEK